ncbi:hypothetical protein [Massilia sp. DWR3-1-1]|uniref:hypothetical protein n=1 Tax=Massilia sp. DWR3-1-1 TaxID=2804559 RepID=UPI003CEB9768
MSPSRYTYAAKLPCINKKRRYFMPRERIGLLQEDVSKRIALLRPLLIIGVVFVHTSGISDMPSQLDPNFFNANTAFFKNGVFRGTVPTMSLIAGFLLF